MVATNDESGLGIGHYFTTILNCLFVCLFVCHLLTDPWFYRGSNFQGFKFSGVNDSHPRVVLGEVW